MSHNILRRISDILVDNDNAADIFKGADKITVCIYIIDNLRPDLVQNGSALISTASYDVLRKKQDS